MLRFDRERFKQLAPTYLIDWAVIILITLAFFMLELIGPFQREFSVDDKTISFPYAQHETVSTLYLFLIAVGIPVVVMACVSIIYLRSAFDLHQSILGLCLGLSIAIGITEVFKITVGRHRPDFLSRCDPPTGTKDPEFKLLTISGVCRQTDKYILEDGSKSFLSGHSSFSFAGMTFLALYLAGKLRVYDRTGRTFKIFLVAIPWVISTLVAISRVADYRHHWQDVFSGSLVGFFSAYFAYRQFYPPVSDELGWKPYKPRILRKVPPDQTPQIATSASAPPYLPSSSPSNQEEMNNLKHFENVEPSSQTNQERAMEEGGAVAIGVGALSKHSPTTRPGPTN